MQTAMGLTPQKPTQRQRFGERPKGLSGSTKSVVGVARSGRDLRDPMDAWPQVGRTERAATGLWGVGSLHSTPRAGEPLTGGRGDGGTQPSQVTCAGHAGPEYTSEPP